MYSEEEIETTTNSKSNSCSFPTLKTEENVNLKNLDDSFEQIELKIEKEEIMTKDDFYSNPNKVHTKFKNPVKNLKVSYSYKKIGNTFTFWYNKEGNPLILIGPFFFCLSFTITFLVYLYFNSLWNYLNPIVRYIGMTIYLIHILSYTYTFLKNPGLPRFDLSPEEGKSRKGLKFCQDCHIFVDLERKVNHCHDCNICIEGYDHHCPWTSKCVGEGNLFGFYVFVASTMILFAYLIFGISVASTK